MTTDFSEAKKSPSFMCATFSYCGLTRIILIWTSISIHLSFELLSISIYIYIQTYNTKTGQGLRVEINHNAPMTTDFSGAKKSPSFMCATFSYFAYIILCRLEHTAWGFTLNPNLESGNAPMTPNGLTPVSKKRSWFRTHHLQGWVRVNRFLSTRTL